MTKLKGKDMEKWMKCYVGTNSLRGSKGIYTLEINTQNGEMREASTVEADDSAYLYVSEKRKCLYAVMESLEYKGVPGGGVAAYRIEDNKLSFLNSRYAYGGWPCHVIADEEKDSLLVSVYPFEFGAFLYCGSTGSAYYDEPKQTGGQGQRACGK